MGGSATDICIARDLAVNLAWNTYCDADAQHYVITDTNVHKLHGARIMASLRDHGLNVEAYVVAPGERSKSFGTYKRICHSLLQAGVSHKTTIIGLGGGVVTNLAGFVAGTLHRGLPLIQLPTTLLGQIDAAVDEKQGINGPHGKNQVGTKYSARLVVVDQSFLSTLPQRYMRNGMAEAIKHALIGQPDLLRMVRADVFSLSWESEFITALVTHTISHKVAMMNRMTFAEELCLQYGHAVGHALEFCSRWRIMHGEAIAIGMCAMAELAYQIGKTDKGTVEEHYSIFSRIGLPTNIPETITSSEVAERVRFDKHYGGKGLSAVLLRRVGQPDIDSALSQPITIQRVMMACEANRRRH